MTESVRIYEKSDVIYTLKYKDKSIVKAKAQITPEELSDAYTFSIDDPFAPENEIEFSCKVVENSDVKTISDGKCQYRLDQYGKLTIYGTGTITPSAVLDQQIENQIAYYVNEKDKRYIKVKVSPFVKSFLTKGFPSMRMRWQWRYKAKIKVVTDQTTGFVEVKYFDKEDNELM